jgi:hypothetical protein
VEDWGGLGLGREGVWIKWRGMFTGC